MNLLQFSIQFSYFAISKWCKTMEKVIVTWILNLSHDNMVCVGSLIYYYTTHDTCFWYRYVHWYGFGTQFRLVFCCSSHFRSIVTLTNCLRNCFLWLVPFVLVIFNVATRIRVLLATIHQSTTSGFKEIPYPWLRSITFPLVKTEIWKQVYGIRNLLIQQPFPNSSRVNRVR